MKTFRGVSLQTIARRSGVSRMAVSLALRGRPGVSPATRRKVVAVAKRMGYAPDPELGKLMARMRQRIPQEVRSCMAFLIPGVAEESRIIPLTEKKYLEGARQRAGEYGYRLEEFPMDSREIPLARLTFADATLWIKK